ncbi:glycosyltransferase family 2 protein [Lutibacter sp. B1]|uniref:glycosyltransferase family 2 protein n=1 Tax=Lutibacter sp. B1 TaxID=2725996 RepID=UPI001456D41D|nr:glycosyltransferase family 2 protein [Lutibacter sp. B1]NLP58170.1 glycosyltransferase family 2 protein [Lutibacter sp. B1]
MSKNKIFIIIVSFNAKEWIVKCINSIITSSIHCEIVLVDNCSSDETLQVVANYTNLTVLPQSNNLGFGAASNIGISFALKNNADYVFLLNQDAYLESNTIDKLIKVHKTNHEFGIISPIHLNGDGTKLDKNFANYSKENNELLFDAIKCNFTKSIYHVPFVNAAAWLLPRNTIETIGGFDPIFFHYGEDDNYCQRAKYHNIKVGIVPNSFIYHDRENRANSMIVNKSKISSDNYYERFLKIKWGNINNINIDNEIEKKNKALKKSILKLVLKLKFKKAQIIFRELKLVKKILPEILKSRKLNEHTGNNYINN